MEQITILNNLYNMYDVENTYNFDLNTYTLNNRLFCTFTNLDEINDTVENLKKLIHNHV